MAEVGDRRKSIAGRLLGFGRINLIISTLALLVLIALPGLIERYADRVANEPLQRLASGEMAALSFDRAGEMAPNVVFQGPLGNDLSFLAFRGKVVLVNLWATWCAPCLAEMPSLDALQARFGGQDFEVVAIALDRGGPAVAAPFLETVGAKNLSLYSETNLLMMSAFGEDGLPVSVLIDEKGYEIARLRGPAEWDSKDAEMLIAYLIGLEIGVEPGAERGAE